MQLQTGARKINFSIEMLISRSVNMHISHRGRVLYTFVRVGNGAALDPAKRSSVYCIVDASHVRAT